MPDQGSLISRDRLSLPRPYIAPRNHMERGLAEIWSAVFNTDRVGVDDSFVDLGGNSLDAEIILIMIETRLGLRISLTTLAETGTVATLAKAITAAAGPNGRVKR